MIIRPAKEEDAHSIARFVAMAEAEMVPLLTGLDDPEKAEEKLAGWIASSTPSRYSYHNNLVAEMDGAPVASMISFAADSQHRLDTVVLEDLHRRGINLERLFPEGAAGTYYLSTMGVDPAYRGRGLGTALIAAAEEKAKRLGFRQTSLLVSTDKPRAQALYERLGFKPAEKVRMADSEYCRMLHDL